MVGPFSERHIYMQWGGTLPGSEIWSCGLRLAVKGEWSNDLGIPDAVEMAAWTDGAIKDAVAAYHTRAGTGIYLGARLTFVKANVVGTDGKYVQGTTNEYVWTGAGLAGAANTYIPANQVSLAVSLTTDWPRGPAHRGRFYLPMPGVVPGADGRFTVAYCAGVATSTKTFLEAIADVPGVDSAPSVTPHVMSRKLGNPTKRMITGVEVGRVPDTIRKRRNKLTEEHQPATLDLGAA